MGDLRVPDLNRVFLAGRLTRDPELRYLPSGVALCKLSVANSRYYKGKDGERREETVFADVTVWERQAEWIGERLRKGRPVLVEGRLRQDEWEDKATGQKRSRLEITAQRVTPLDWDEDGRSGGATSRPASAAAPSSAPSPRVIEEPIPEDDIPF
jgi:single-strand DNA-binding protein